MTHVRFLLQPRLVLRYLVLTVVLFVLAIVVYRTIAQPRTEQALFLVISDKTPIDSPQVRLWVDAASETGLPLRVMPVSELLRPKPWPTLPVGIVLPDGMLQSATLALTDRLRGYVQQGGNLMVVFDAATRFRPGEADNNRARMSGLIGVDYALYDQLRDAAIRRAPVEGEAGTMRALHVPPGKFMPASGNRVELTTYEYGAVSYPSFVTRGRYKGRVLLSGRDGNLVAGLGRSGKGQVLFVNLPLGYLKLRSDGMLLHGFLSWFGEEICGLPRLLAVPDGIGGLVLNWHIDSNASLEPLKTLQSETSLFAHGPYSVHFTAGPDTYKVGDRSGLDLEHNPESQAWVRLFAAKGNAIGSHGGWAHNVFAAGINDHNDAEFAPWIARNNAALEALVGQPVTEYSAPEGRHPQWVTDWLQDHGILGYYFTGDTGMAPTRSYRDGKRSDRTTWAFPLVPYGRVASFEDAAEAGVPQAEIGHWLVDLAGFVAVDRSVRLFYFHPPGGIDYPRSVQSLLDAIDARGNAFRWYTISGLSTFLNRREKTRWSFDDDRNGWLMSAHNPDGLANLAWHVPASSYSGVTARDGDLAIVAVEDGWLVRVQGGQSASV
ncbi:MAG: polysaccharide deacetylase family protein, partial [Pseudomonadota bacterium]|nr:polysaccharide deacetylase family protein [Pseudomonadota bacterium]